MWVGKDYDKNENLCYCRRMSYPIFDFRGKSGDSVNKLHQVCHLFLFSMTVDN